jgi:hypothetical protein
MRSLILTIALMVGSLGAVAITPAKADARPPWGRWYDSYYGDPYYSSYGPRWYGGSYWRGGTWWGPRSYSYSYYPAPYSYGTYYGPRYYYGRSFAPRYYYWP